VHRASRVHRRKLKGLFQSLLPGRMFLERRVNPEWPTLEILKAVPKV
jgi:hypothetical protein